MPFPLVRPIRNLATLFTLATSLALTSTTHAQDSANHSAVPESAGWEFGLSAGQAQLDKDAAAKAYIGDSADLFTLNVQYYFANSPWMINAGGGSLSYDDQLGFSQVVREEYSGDTYSKDSSASGTILFIEAGANYPLNAALFLQGRLGLSSVFGSSRSIENCKNCWEEDFDINGGAYGSFTFGGTIANKVELALQYQYYLSGDLASAVSLNIGSHFF
ncbi:MAG TPA: hypothetical protein PKE57_04845 [Cellvibrionaceae bacterium]|nr:hypothetical protein [Cellvibrionaceae bacterium]HMW70266.1 hypothetical protein [Cellvibrionaceae bacterium]HMY39235.1 hypothetical protein [Marinagarivorans sp.]HNG59631.1 hypothetical protein [Cellvibrionaceae bacterium]